MAHLYLLEQDGSSCLRIKFGAKLPNEIKFSDVYAVELTDYGLIHKGNCLTAANILMRRESPDSEV